MKNQNSVTNYGFFHSDDPDTLVMLASRESVLQLLLKEKIASLFIWIYKQSQKQVQQKIKEICLHSSAAHKLFTTVSEVSDFLATAENLEKVFIITQSETVDQAIYLMRNSCCFEIIEYSYNFDCDDQTDVSEQYEVVHKNHFLQNSSLKIHKLENQSTLKLFLQQNSQTLPQFRDFPNFVTLKDERSQSNQQVCCMTAMLNQVTSHRIKSIILDELKQIKKQVSQEVDDEYMFEKLKRKQLSSEDILEIYSNERTQFYKLLNNFLRALKNPTQLFYIYPFFRDIFDTIQKLDRSKVKSSSFVCYRGGFVTNKEMQAIKENVGGFMQNLCFMSTSLDEQVASVFMKNALFIINVEVGPQQNKFSYGFADISKFSCFYTQREILFNPLNYFKIIYIKTCQNLDESNQPEIYIFMDFSQGLTQSNENNCQQQENETSFNFQLSSQNLYTNLIKSQGDVFRYLFKKDSMNLSLQYWQQYCRICMKNQSIFSDKGSLRLKYERGLLKQAFILSRQGKLQQSIELYNKLNINSSNFQTQVDEQLISSLFFMAHYYHFFNRFGKTMEIYKKCRLLLENLTSQVKQLQQTLQIHMAYSEVLQYKSLKSYQKLKQTVDATLKRYEDENKSVKINRVTVFALLVVSHALFEQKKYSQIIIYLKKCLTYLMNVYGPNAEKYVVTLCLLAFCQFQIGDVQGSIKIFRSCMQPLEQFFGEGNLDLLDINCNYASVLTSKGNFQEALQIYTRCAKIRKQVTKTFNEHQILNLMSIAFILYRNFFQYRAALRLLGYCQRQMIKNRGSDHFLSIKVTAWIIGIYKTWGRQRRASQLSKKFGYSDAINQQSSDTVVKYKQKQRMFNRKHIPKCYIDISNL